MLKKYLTPPTLSETPVAVEKVGSKTVFPLGEFLLVCVFLPAVCFLRGCHRWLRSLVEEPHQSFQVLCHGS
jgi:hypothetical protein